MFLLENVHGISYTGKEEGFLLLEKLTRKINAETGSTYKLSWKVLNAAEFGVPQRRTRFFLVGHRDGGTFSFPAPTHKAEEDGESLVLAVDEREAFVTAWDAIGGLQVPPMRSSRPKATGETCFLPFPKERTTSGILLGREGFLSSAGAHVTGVFS